MPLRASPWLFVLLLSACAVSPPTAPPVPSPIPRPAPEPAPAPPAAPIPTPAVTYSTLKPVSWSSVGLGKDEQIGEAWVAFLRSCATLVKQSGWQAVCSEAMSMPPPDDKAARAFFEQRFQPYQATQEDGSTDGMITGYYEPLLKGDRVRTERARYPLYAAPDDLITVDLASIYPELKSLRLRGRLVGNKIVPYLTRKEIEQSSANGSGDGFKGKPIAWAEDPVDLFFLQIQGSGRIELPDGSHMRVGYADQNGYPYLSIGKLLVERGELKLEQASMQGIKDWGAKHPDKLPELLASNPSFVFFRELPDGLPGPLGSLGVPLTGGRSIAVDPKFIPLGAPVFLATTRPNSTQPMNRLVMAQDSGGAIKGGVRADFFWGFGDEAGELAGRMKQRGRMWVLLPKALSGIVPR
ncbi:MULTISPECIES: MltA domain-containing protein [unclassified Thiobacillus]|uniref:murein transglycosylase A n=1 Tax=unclassified Thiobacillus TaxID=2646513 RepID=UPI00086B9219|nr:MULTISPECIES: MltA domain-containing protein [unclassified Thiobacillus]MBN8778470.1 MltA domain-containing protein [Thiobacillus sp.]ODV01077.1 MAG: transglycosylase [Thiobacillus sp. SCN 63-57]